MNPQQDPNAPLEEPTVRQLLVRVLLAMGKSIYDFLEIIVMNLVMLALLLAMALAAVFLFTIPPLGALIIILIVIALNE